MNLLARFLGIGSVMMLLMISDIYAQKYKSDSSYVRFFSSAPMEDIEATNFDGQSAFNLATGEVVFSIPITSFTFQKSLMQEHFNENYMESDKYPTASFRGKISGYDPAAQLSQKATATGIMKIHGVEQEISVLGELRFNEGKVEMKAIFPIKLEDYKIKIPKVVFYNIAEIVEVTIIFNYEKID